MRTRLTAMILAAMLATPTTVACGPATSDCDAAGKPTVAQYLTKPGGGGKGSGSGSKGSKTGGGKSKKTNHGTGVHVNTGNDCDEDD